MLIDVVVLTAGPQILVKSDADNRLWLADEFKGQTVKRQLPRILACKACVKIMLALWENARARLEVFAAAGFFEGGGFLLLGAEIVEIGLAGAAAGGG